MRRMHDAMAATPMQEPLALLREIERRCGQNAAGLPSQVETKPEWIGVGFRLGQAHLLAPLGEVLEILTYPGQTTRVPGARPWVKGIANVRGNLLPIMDLQACLNGRQTDLNPGSRVLVVSHKGVFAGLLVDEVLGLKHFQEEQRTQDLPPLDASITPYLKRAYHDGDEHWGVFSLYKLAESQLFLQAAG